MTIAKNTNIKIDELESAMLNGLEVADCPLLHVFFPKIYTRQILMKAGTILTSRIHKTEHPFFVMKGKVTVYSDNDGGQVISAPHFGRTLPATRRVLYIHEDCVWITIHPLDFITGDENNWSNDKKDELIKKIEDILIEPHINSVTNTDSHKDYKELLNKRRLS